MSCGRPLDPSWNICPYCEAEIPGATPTARRRRRREAERDRDRDHDRERDRGRDRELEREREPERTASFESLESPPS
jgi:hypothetical protein